MKLRIILYIILGLLTASFSSLVEPKLYNFMISLNSLFAYSVSIIFLVPILEETLKYLVLIYLLRFSEDRKIVVLLYAYSFQIYEMFFNMQYELFFYFRLFLPIHIYFCMISTEKYRFSLLFAIVLHMLWNSQIIFPVLLYVLTFFYLIHFFILVTEKKEITKHIKTRNTYIN